MKTEYEILAENGLEGFKKIGQDHGGSLICALFWKPETNETVSKTVRDYEYSDCSRDNDDLYWMEIDEEARVNYLHANGMILEGDRVMVIKGRKIPLGEVKTVRKIYPFKDRYGRWIADYLYFTDGTKTNMRNCILVMETKTA